MFSQKALYWFSRPIVGTYSGTMLRMDVHKHRELPVGPKIIAANHPSTTDPFFVAAMVKYQSFILINDLLFQVPILGEYLRRSGHIPVKVGQGQVAIDTALQLLKEGKTIMIFPEGDLSPEEGGFLRSRTGVARLALASGAPVIPVGIHLERDRIHSIRSIVSGKAEYGRWYLSGPYHMTVGASIQFNGDTEDRTLVRTVADYVMNQIINLARESKTRRDRTAAAINGAFYPN
jgi:1-acyl-sn-glycerol-3-phosphate acyltransferase